MTASLFSVMRWHGSVGHTSKHKRTVGLYHGKAVLCSNIHHRAVIGDSSNEDMCLWWKYRSSRVD